MPQTKSSRLTTRSRRLPPPAPSRGGDFGGFGGGGAKKEDKDDKEGDANKSSVKEDADDEYSLAVKAKAKAHPRVSLAAAMPATPSRRLRTLRCAPG